MSLGQGEVEDVNSAFKVVGRFVGNVVRDEHGMKIVPEVRFLQKFLKVV